MLQAGPLNTLVAVKQQASGTDAEGQPNGEWSTVCAPWARITFSSGVELIKAGAQMSDRRANIRIRYRTNITAGMRVYHGAIIFNIVAVLPQQVSKEYVDLACEVAQ